MANPTITRYTVSGTDYVFSFPYLDPSHVKVTIAGVEVPYTLPSANTVRIVPTGYIGEELVIRRTTPKTPIHTWEGGAVLLATTLNASHLQGIYVSEEAMDYAEGMVDEATAGALEGVDAAVAAGMATAVSEVNSQGAAQVALAAAQVTLAAGHATTAAGHVTAATGKVAECQALVDAAQAAVTDIETAISSAVDDVIGPAAAAAVEDVSEALDAKVDAAEAHVTTAAGHATAASNSATAAAGSATTASGHASTAAGHVSTAAGHVATALGHANTASGHADDAEAALAAFGLYWKGAHASAPETTQVGAIYFDTTLNKLQHWNGTAWTLAYNELDPDAEAVPASEIANDSGAPGSSVADALAALHSGKAATSHTHAIASVTGLQTALEGKAGTSHSHAIADTTGLQAALDGKSATGHGHAIADVTGLQSALDGKTATGHTHSQSDVSGLTSALAGKAAVSHSHAISDVTNLQSALDGKAGTSHSHAIADTTGLQTTLDAKVAATRSVSTSGLATGGGNLTADRTINVPKAAAADLRGGTNDDKALTAKAAYDAVAPVALTFGTTVGVDFSAGSDFTLIMTDDATLGAPTNVKPGQKGVMRIIQGGGGGYSLAKNAVWKTSGGAAFELSSGVGAIDYLSYYAYSSTEIWASLSPDVN